MPEQRDEAYELVAAQQQTEIESLRAQLAAANAEVQEQARLNGMGAEREAKLLAQLAEVTALKDRLLQTVATHAEEVGGYYSQLLATQAHAARLVEVLQGAGFRAGTIAATAHCNQSRELARFILREIDSVLYTPINLDALHEDRARECERLAGKAGWAILKPSLLREAAAHRAKKQEPVVIQEPNYHHEAMGCGLEDRGITDRYEAMQYGWDCAVERLLEQVPDEPIYTHPAIPGRVALPDGWVKTIGEAARLLQAWIDEEGGCDCEGTHHCGLPALRTCIAELHAMLSASPAAPADAVAKDADALKRIQSKLKSATMCHPNGVMFLVEEALEIADAAMLSAAPTPPTQPQWDGSLRRGAE